MALFELNFKNGLRLHFYSCFFFILILLCLWPGFSNTSNAQIVPISDPEMDSTYIELNYTTWSLRAFGAFKYHNLVISNNSGGKIKYVPTNPFSAGVGFAYRFIIMDIGFRINKDYRITRFDCITNLVFQKIMFEILTQRYEGFEEVIGTSEEYLRDDIKSTLISISQFYNFNNQKLSLSSTFSGNKIQKRSTGAFIIGSYFSYSKIESDSSLIPASVKNQFNDSANFNNFSTLNVGAYFGYAYGLVLPGNFIFFSNLIPGIGFNFTTENDSETYMPPIFPAGKLHFRISCGYYTKRIYTILGLTTNLSVISLGDENRFRQNGGQIKLVFGYRFNSINPLTKTIDKTF